MKNFDLTQLEIREEISFFEYSLMINEIIAQIFVGGKYEPGRVLLATQATMVKYYTNLMVGEMELEDIWDLINCTGICDMILLKAKSSKHIEDEVNKAIQARLSTCGSFEMLIKSLVQFLDKASTADVSADKSDTKELISLFGKFIENPEALELFKNGGTKADL